MPGFDIDSPSPDRGHEAIRVAVVQAITDLGQNVADTADGFYLTDVIFELLDTALTQVADLEARVAALEATTAPNP